MASERQSQQDGNDRDRRVPGRHGKVKQANNRAVRNMLRGQRMNDLELYLEPLLRKVVREELPPILQRHLFPCCGATLNQTGTSGVRDLQLCFTNKLPPTIFTHTKIISEGGAPLRIALCDARSHNCIVNEGPLSSTKIELCVLNGEFGSNGAEDWTAEEFNANISPQRDNKGSLLNGDKFFKLENGVGFITKVEITDNSSWTRSRKFRLGVKVVQSPSNEANIREGRSEPFVVKDKRGESYKKHDRPSLNDEIWRLKKIAKDGKIHRQLSSHKVKTVEDLLQLYTINRPSLEEKIGNIKKKSWDTIIEHAKTCVIEDGNRYIYYYRTAEQLIGLLFNSIYELEAVTFDGQNRRSLESLNSEEERLVKRARQNAYENVKDFIKLETVAGLQAEQFNAPSAQQGQPETRPGFCQPSTSTSYIGEAIHDDQVFTDQLPLVEEMLLDSYGFHMDGNGCPLNGSQIQFANYLSPLSPWGQGNPFYLPSGDRAELGYQSSFPNSAVVISSRGKRKTVWNKIRNALKLFIPYVAKRKGKLFPYNH